MATHTTDTVSSSCLSFPVSHGHSTSGASALPTASTHWRRDPPPLMRTASTEIAPPRPPQSPPLLRQLPFPCLSTSVGRGADFFSTRSSVADSSARGLCSAYLLLPWDKTQNRSERRRGRPAPMGWASREPHRVPSTTCSRGIDALSTSPVTGNQLLMQFYRPRKLPFYTGLGLTETTMGQMQHEVWF